MDRAPLPLLPWLPLPQNVKGLPGTPDIVLRKYGIVIFIHGCFWHGHEVDGTMPKTNREFWKIRLKGTS